MDSLKQTRGSELRLELPSAVSATASGVFSWRPRDRRNTSPCLVFPSRPRSQPGFSHTGSPVLERFLARSAGAATRRTLVTRATRRAYMEARTNAVNSPTFACVFAGHLVSRSYRPRHLYPPIAGGSGPLSTCTLVPWPFVCQDRCFQSLNETDI